MKHMTNYVSGNFHEEMLEFVENDQCNEAFEETKYKINRFKEKWNRFWNWVFGDSDTSEYNPFSNEYDADKFAKAMAKCKKSSSKYSIRWVKVNSMYEKNMKYANHLLSSSDKKTNSGFWRTREMLSDHKKNVDDYKIVLGLVTMNSFDNIENSPIIILVRPKIMDIPDSGNSNKTVKGIKVSSIEIIKEYVDIIDWNDIFEYLHSDAFIKGWFKDPEQVQIFISEDMQKYAKNDVGSGKNNTEYEVTTYEYYLDFNNNVANSGMKKDTSKDKKEKKQSKK